MSPNPDAFMFAENVLYFEAGESRLIHEFVAGGTPVQIKGISGSGSSYVRLINDTFYYAQNGGSIGGSGFGAYKFGAEFGECVISYGSGNALIIPSPMFSFKNTLHVVEQQAISNYTRNDKDCHVILRFTSIDP